MKSNQDDCIAPSRKGKHLNESERQYGSKLFRETFKSITCDNGSEFLDFQSLEKSLFNKTHRTKLYYAHPFSSFERGSNENANRLIRRLLPKKTTFDTLTQNDINRLAEWMNRYPRRIFEGNLHASWHVQKSSILSNLQPK